MKKIGIVALAGVIGPCAFAQFTVNEIFVNPSGTDDGWEFMEIKGASNASLSGMYFISMEGDGSGAGLADIVIDLGTTLTSLGTNGLGMMRWGTNVSAIEAGTTVFTQSVAGGGSLENGSNTFMLVTGFVPVAGTDYDADNNGILDANFGGSIVDSVGWTDTAATGDFAYGALKYINGTIGTFTPDAFSRLPGDGAIFGDVKAGTGITNFDEVTADRTAFYSQYRGNNMDGTVRDADWEGYATSGFANPGDPNRLDVVNQTPGGTNPVPEPASIAILGLGLIGLAVRRKRSKA